MSGEHQSFVFEDTTDRPKNILQFPIGRGVRVAVIDSGLDPAYPTSRIDEGVDLTVIAPVETGGPPVDRIGHGTACTDLILRRAQGVTVMPVKVFDTRLETSPDVLARAVGLCVDRGVRVVNLSLGTRVAASGDALRTVCDAAFASGIHIVAAARSGPEVCLPAGFPNVIGVMAERFPQGYGYSYASDAIVECKATGYDVSVRWLGGRVVGVSGSSFAAPLISAVVAILCEQYPGATAADIRELLAAHATRP